MSEVLFRVGGSPILCFFQSTVEKAVCWAFEHDGRCHFMSNCVWGLPFRRGTLLKSIVVLLWGLPWHLLFRVYGSPI